MCSGGVIEVKAGHEFFSISVPYLQTITVVYVMMFIVYLLRRSWVNVTLF